MTLERFDGAAAWGELDPDQQADIGAAALELVAAWNLQERVFEDPLDARYAKLGEIADAVVIARMMEAFVDAVGREALEAADGSPRVPDLLGPICRVCGCTERNACEGGCGWAEDDLCTACAAPARGQVGRR